jgi:hypothetical protein
MKSGGSTTASATVLQAGNNLYANGCTIAITDSFAATKISTKDAGGGANDFAGGGFTWATAGGDKTFTSNIEAGTTTCLTISGSTAGAVGTIIGSITGSSTTGSTSGVLDTHTVGTIAVTGNITAGSAGAASAVGYTFSGSSGALNVTGDATGAVAKALYFNDFTAASVSITGKCIGGTAGYAWGCHSYGTRPITVKGSIESGTREQGAAGTIIWDPPSTSNYIKMTGDGSPAAYYATQVPAEADVKSGVEYGWDGSDHYTGSYSSGGGGGAWGF